MTQRPSYTASMVRLMETLAPVEGYNLSPLDDVRFLRCNRPLTRTPVLYDPDIVILCQGHALSAQPTPTIYISSH